MFVDHSDCSSSPDADRGIHEAGEENNEKKVLARKENKAVQKLRIIVFSVLLLTAALVTTLVYLYTRNDEEEDFEAAFEASGHKVVESFHQAVGRKLGALDSLAVSITSHARSTNSPFPNVTLPDFAIQAATTRILADSFNVAFSLYVTDENRAGWEAYASQNLAWLDEGLASEIELRDEQDEKFGYPPTFMDPAKFSSVFNTSWHETIFNPKGPSPPGSGPYLVLWQTSPFLPGTSNLTLPGTRVWNLDKFKLKSFKHALYALMETSQAVLGNMIDMSPGSVGKKGIREMLLYLSQYRHLFDSFSGEPSTTLAYPVFNSYGSDREVVGVLDTQLVWRQYFSNILPDDVKGIICVLENNYNQTVSFRIDGKEATFIGWGDHHQTQYDHMEILADVVEYLGDLASPETQSYTVVGLNAKVSYHTLRVFPSSSTEEEYVTDNPIVYAVVVIGVFLFTSLVFVAYDYMVERRQDVVMNRAVASGAIVSSLFPEQVRDQLYAVNGDEKKSTWLNQDVEASLQGVADEISHKQNVDLVGASKPIAEKFDATTVFFADLAGFTKWSSTREPEEVFVLFETLYGAIDSIAHKRRVFKVETIGDCYMAVTGLPQAQEDHAVRMARFASECMDKQIEVAHNLKQTLGEETAELQMRIGLHSGPVTAGVLRGQKARFQLFGDTVNTASRMESNGARGKIQASQSTADELTARGKGHWLTPREDTIVAKGKGEMKTYWVNIKADKSVGSLRSGLSTSKHGEDEADIMLSQQLNNYLSKRSL